MKCMKTNENEIDKLFGFLNDLLQLSKDLETYNLEDIDFSDIDRNYTEIKDCSAKKEDDDYHNNTILNIVSKVYNINYQRILTNCSTMLENCADKDNSVLDYNPDIKEGLKLLEEKRKIK